MEAKAREDRPHTWHDLQAVADHLADHGASDEEILSALATDNARWGVRVVRHAMITFADRALERGGGCDCNGPKPVGVKRGKDYYLRLDMDIVDWWMPWLGEAELKVLWYIYRRTRGFDQPSATISIAEFMHGKAARNGTPLEAGTGLSRTAVVRAARALAAAGLIVCEPQRIEGLGNVPTRYAPNPERPPRPPGE